MSALQIDNPSSDPVADSRDYSLADLRAAVLDDRGMTLVVRIAVGVLLAVAVAILVAGVATQSAFAVVASGLATIVLAGTLIALTPVPATLIGR